MCGITGYIGHRDAYPIIIQGLQRLEYRGYDSAGVVLYDGKNINLSKTKGKVSDLQKKAELEISIEGKIDGAEKEKILNWFPHTELTINDKEYNKGKNGWVLVSGNTIPIEVLELKEIWILEIWNMEDAEDKLIIPDALKEIRIDNLSLVNYTSRKNIEKIRELLPKTNLYVQGKKITNAR